MTNKSRRKILEETRELESQGYSPYEIQKIQVKQALEDIIHKRNAKHPMRKWVLLIVLCVLIYLIWKLFS